MPSVVLTQRTIRKSLALVTAATIVVGLAACSGGSSDAESGGGSTKITFWHGYTDAEADALKKLGTQWNTEHPTSQVDLVFDGGNDGVLQKTIAGFTAGKAPDVAYQYGSSVAALSRQPKLVDLTDRVKDPAFKWDDFFISERQAGSVGDKVLAVPALVDNLSLVYNTAMFEKAGVPLPTADWTWQDFRSAAAKLTNKQDKTFGWAYVNDGSEDTVWRYLAMLWQAGGDLLTADNTKPAFDSTAGLAALTQLKDMAVTDKSVYLDSGNQNYLNLFNSGKVAMLWTGPWDLNGINKDVKYGVTLLPGYNGDHQTISGPDLYMLFNNSDKNVNASWDFIKWLVSPEVHMQFALDTGDLPIRQSETELPEYQEFLKKYPANKVFVENLNNVKHVRPNIANYNEVSVAVGKMVQAVLLGQAEPQAALDSARDQVTGVLAGS
jgi:multiple sugar transport system substrate-binding protein